VIQVENDADETASSIHSKTISTTTLLSKE
jgi:hypothetical protein